MAVEVDEDSGVVQIAHPAVRARVTAAGIALGRVVRVRLVAADPASRTVAFEPA